MGQHTLHGSPWIKEVWALMGTGPQSPASGSCGEKPQRSRAPVRPSPRPQLKRIFPAGSSGPRAENCPNSANSFPGPEAPPRLRNSSTEKLIVVTTPATPSPAGSVTCHSVEGVREQLPHSRLLQSLLHGVPRADIGGQPIPALPQWRASGSVTTHQPHGKEEGVTAPGAQGPFSQGTWVIGGIFCFSWVQRSSSAEARHSQG